MHIHHVTPILNVSDIQQSFEWFGKLGMKKLWGWGDPVDFGAVGANECEIFLCQGGQGGRGRGSNTATFGEQGGQSADQGMWMSLWVDNVDAVHANCIEQAIEVMMEPRDLPWNTREMHIRHPDGHVFRVSQGISG